MHFIVACTVVNMLFITVILCTYFQVANRLKVHKNHSTSYATYRIQEARLLLGDRATRKHTKDS